jgi:hypothetical protein
MTVRLSHMKEDCRLRECLTKVPRLFVLAVIPKASCDSVRAGLTGCYETIVSTLPLAC